MLLEICPHSAHRLTTAMLHPALLASLFPFANQPTGRELVMLTVGDFPRPFLLPLSSGGVPRLCPTDLVHCALALVSHPRLHPAGPLRCTWPHMCCSPIVRLGHQFPEDSHTVRYLHREVCWQCEPRMDMHLEELHTERGRQKRQSEKEVNGETGRQTGKEK